MNKLGAFLTVLFAPLIGALTWMSEMMYQIHHLAILSGEGSGKLWTTLVDDFDGFLTMVFAGWLYALFMTVVLGLPIGFAISFLMKKLNFEGLLHYIFAGLVAALLLNFVLWGGGEFQLSQTITGGLLGLGFWMFVRRPVLRAVAT